MGVHGREIYPGGVHGRYSSSRVHCLPAVHAGVHAADEQGCHRAALRGRVTNSDVREERVTNSDINDS